MKATPRYILLLLIAFLALENVLAQNVEIREIHKVKRKETIFGIAKLYGISIEELMSANPEMHSPGYELKKGDKLNIPYKQVAVVNETVAVSEPETIKPSKTDVRKREVRLGVMLPLNDKNAETCDMIEYYRGVLMACDSLKDDGVSIDIHAWNVMENTDLNNILSEETVGQCDLIIGPYYSKHLKPIADFALENDVKVLVPFVINSTEVYSNPNLFIASQKDSDYQSSVIKHFLDKFSNHHVVFIDCNDANSTKGGFTRELRTRLEGLHREYTITNLNTQESDFSKAFSLTSPNVVILNSQRSAQLNIAFAKLNTLMLTQNDLQVSMFGYKEWINYTNYNLDNYYKFDTYIPSTSFLNPLSSRTARMQQKYRRCFNSEMSKGQPFYALIGFDHAYYFIKGLKMYGSLFDGRTGSVGYTPIQTPLGFEKYENGGMQNKSILFIHYTQGHRIETVNY